MNRCSVFLFAFLIFPTNHRPMPGKGEVEVGYNGGKRPLDEDLSIGDAVGAKQGRHDSLTEILGLDDDRPCYFETLRKTDKETKPRSAHSSVSQGCEGAMHKLSLLTDKNQFLGTVNELDILMSRGAGEFWKDYSDEEVINEFAHEFVCEKHRKELSSDWENPIYNHYSKKRPTSRTPPCSFPDQYHGSRRPNIRKLLSESNSVTKEEAKAVMALEGNLLHVGLPVCPHHKALLADSVAQFRVQEKGYNLEPRPEQGLLSRASSVSTQPITNAVASDVHQPPPSPYTSKISPNAISLFRSFAKEVGEERLTLKKPLAELKHRSMQKKVCAARRLIDVIFNIIALDEKEEFARRAMSPAADVWTAKKTSSKYDNLLSNLAERFNSAPGRREKELAVAAVAETVPLLELRNYIPGLTERLYYKARRIARNGLRVEEEKFTRMRYNPSKLQYFIDFITSPLIASDLPFGEQRVTLSDGSKMKIPNSLRLQRHVEIVEMYNAHMKKTGMEKLLFANSTLYKLLRACSSTMRKASVCVDYYYSDSELAFENLFDTVDFIVAQQRESATWKKDVTERLKESRFYLKGDFRSHTKMHSRVADHCWSSALSDPEEEKLSNQCSHEENDSSHSHDLTCGRCEMVREVLGDIRDSLINFQKSVSADASMKKDDQMRLLETIEDYLVRALESEERIIEYKKHQLRSAFSYKTREDILERLQEGEAAITCDFGQKFLPMRFLERQTDYFGKRGLSFHISHIVSKKDGSLLQHAMVHVIQNDRQDSMAVSQIIEHVLLELAIKKIRRVYLRSDNAPAYHSSSTLTSIPGISKRTGVQVVEYNYSESQNGKSAADRVAGTVKTKVRAFVDGGKNAKDHQEFFIACTSGRLLDSTSFYLATVEERPTSKNKIARISEFHDFRFEANGMRAWRHREIGEGIFYPYKSFPDDGNGGSLWIMSKGGYFPVDGEQDRFWKKSAPKENRVTDDTHLFSCPELTCSESFESLEDLEAHVLEGSHSVSPLKMTMRDRSLHMFKAHLEGVAQSRLQIPEVDDVVRELEHSDDDGLPKVEKGYALKKKKASVRYKESAKEFICDLFDEGIRTGTKISPETAEKRMFSERKSDGSKRFSAEERLNSRQIASLYSRIASDREKKKGNICAKVTLVPGGGAAAGGGGGAKRGKCQGKKGGGRGKRQAEVEEDVEIEDIDENLYFSDAGYLSDGDLVAQALNDSLHEIFDLSEPREIFEEEMLQGSSRWTDDRFLLLIDPDENIDKELFDPNPQPDPNQQSDSTADSSELVDPIPQLLANADSDDCEMDKEDGGEEAPSDPHGGELF